MPALSLAVKRFYDSSSFPDNPMTLMGSLSETVATIGGA